MPQLEKNKAMLRLSGVSKIYPGKNPVHALNNVSLNVPSGIFGLLGPNGAGKSTLMSIIATLQRPDRGSIHLGEIDALASPREMRAKLGYLPQDFGTYPGASAEELLHYFARLKGISNAAEREHQIGTLLEMVNLDAAKNRPVSDYSGGMRQRFGVAQALLGHPKLLIVDEPTAGLDPAERNRFNQILANIGENTAIILSTHIIEDVSNLCRRIAVINQGRIMAEGDPEKLTASLSGQLWQALVDRERADQISKNGQLVFRRIHRGLHLVVIQSETQPAEDFTPKIPDLEDAYFLAVLQKNDGEN
ncbi:MAG: ABC transporter ATP-binding protein [Zymomonas mobilis]|uniref:ABC transporter ATP-binding protein n=1 Tax=Zymomonas mobilis TaxID=542 RepID=UPI0039E84F16